MVTLVHLWEKHVENKAIEDTCKLNTIVLAVEKQDIKSKKLS